MHDNADTLAIAEIMKYSLLHEGNNDWLASLLTNPEATKEEWRKVPIIARLDSERANMRYWTPLESLECAIDAVKAARAARLEPNGNLAMANLDKLRQSCVKYLDQCRAWRKSAGVVGFVNYLHESEPGQAEGNDAAAVHVLTYHKSKGLEWPVVILYDLDSNRQADAFTACVFPAEEFDANNPLANRFIHFWPNPVPGKRKSAELDDLLFSRPEQKAIQADDRRERQRLLYVGMTRAKDCLILAAQKGNTAARGDELYTDWLDVLADAEGKPLLQLPLTAGENILTIGNHSLTVTTRDFSHEVNSASSFSRKNEKVFLPALSNQVSVYPPTKIQPSAYQPDDGGFSIDQVEIKLAIDFNARVPIKGKPEYSRLGNAVHAFLGLDCTASDGAMVNDLAMGILRRWGVEQVMSAQDLVEIRERLLGFINLSYPGAVIRREWPMSMRNQENQLLQGWIDMLLEVEGGYVIIDHKTYPGSDLEHIKRFAPQLSIYKNAVTRITGKSVLATLVHLPVISKIIELTGL